MLARKNYAPHIDVYFDTSVNHVQIVSSLKNI